MLPKIDIKNQIQEINDDDSPSLYNKTGLEKSVMHQVSNPLIKMVSLAQKDQSQIENDNVRYLLKDLDLTPNNDENEPEDFQAAL